jgi:glycosyltransferase involved in cell wall biosynthesis
MIVVASCGHNCDDERIYYKQIQTLISNDYEVKYFAYCNKTFIENEYTENIEYRFFNSTEISQAQYKTIVFNLLKNNPPEIFHIHDMELLSVAYKLKKIHPNIKIIYDVHEDLEAMWDTFSSYSVPIKSIINFILKKYEQWFLSCVDSFILANKLARTTKYNNYGEVHIIENFPLMADLKSNHKEHSAHKLIYHGQLGEDRGIITLIDAMSKLEKKYRDLELILIGTPRNENFKKILLKKINESKSIKWIEQIPHKEIWEFLNEASIGIIPFHNETIWNYNTPTKLFEYMISNCAVVASELKPIKEFCNETASWTTPGDIEGLIEAIEYYFNNKDVYQKHRKKNVDLITNYYNWDSISKKLLNIYEDLLR